MSLRKYKKNIGQVDFPISKKEIISQGSKKASSRYSKGKHFERHMIKNNYVKIKK